HISDHRQRVWLRQVIESGDHRWPPPAELRRHLLERLTRVEGLETYLHKAFLGRKQFSIEGIDALVPMLDETIELAAEAGAREIVLGMAHRGRLNVIAHTVGRGYQTGGTLHIITNNQVGFTTDPEEGRSTRYASDLAKGFDIPIIHVNADDVENCIAAVRLGMAYRNRFGRDILIDLIGYRRFGHNEQDEPAYTQPAMYERIKKH